MRRIMEIDFALHQMTALRYFMPLIIEANKRGIKSNFFVGSCGKYNSPHLYKDLLFEISKRCGVKLWNLEFGKKRKNFMFFVGKNGLKELDIKADNRTQKVVILTYMTDFTRNHEEGHNHLDMNKVDHMIYPSRYMAEYYGKNSDKNLYLGSPKYDIELDKEHICKKYNLKKSDKKVLVIFPRNRDVNKIDLNQIYRGMRKMGYKVLVKTRGKDPVEDRFKGDYYFTDNSWYPHTTMELIEVSDLVVNFSSTSIKECVMLKTPIVNFNIKPFELLLDFLYDYSYCEQVKIDFTFEDLQTAVKNLTENNHNLAFDYVIDNYLFKKENTSARILDYLELKQ